MKNFYQKHTTLCLILIALLATAILAGAAIGILIALEPWAAEGSSVAAGASSVVADPDGSSDQQESTLVQNTTTATPTLTSSSLPAGVYFYENFYNGLKESDGWEKNASVSGGTYRGSLAVLSSFEPVCTLKDYAVEVEVTVNMFPAPTTSLSVAAVIGRYVTQGENSGGYEVGLVTVTEDSSTYIRVYDRLKAKTVCTFKNVSFESSRPYMLTAVFSGSNLLVFLDDNFVGKTTVENRAGGIGLRRSGYPAVFDDLTVRKATADELAAKSTASQATASSADLPEGVYFYEDFEKNLTAAKGWSSSAQVQNGQYTGRGIYLTNHASVSALQDYAIDAQVMIDPFSTCSSGVSVAAIIGRYATQTDADGKAVSGGLELGFAFPKDDLNGTYLRVYDRLAKKQLCSFTDLPLYAGQVHKLTAVFSGDTLALFLDDNFVGKTQVAVRKGTAGMSANGYTAHFDDFTVRKPTADELTAAGIQ